MGIRHIGGDKAAEVARFNEFLQTLRDEHSLRQADVAREIGMDQGAISKAAAGANRGGLSDRMVHLLRERFGVSPEWLRRGTGSMWLSPEERPPSPGLAPAPGGPASAGGRWTVELTDEEARLVLAFRACPRSERPGILRTAEEARLPAGAPSRTERKSP